MELMAESPARTKKSTEPRRATGVYFARTSSSSADVARACVSFSAISTALALVFSSVLMSSALSRMFPWAFESSRRSVSSRVLSSCLLLLISPTSASRASSRSGRSCRTVTFRSCASRPCGVSP